MYYISDDELILCVPGKGWNTAPLRPVCRDGVTWDFQLDKPAGAKPISYEEFCVIADGIGATVPEPEAK